MVDVSRKEAHAQMPITGDCLRAQRLSTNIEWNWMNESVRVRDEMRGAGPRKFIYKSALTLLVGGACVSANYLWLRQVSGVVS